MKNKEFSIWLKISLFYSRDRWHTLLNDCIRPFLASVKNKKMITYSYIFLSKNQGDNIRISLLTCNDSLTELYNDLTSHVNNFIKLHPSLTTVPANEPLDFFANFPNNSFQYNLYKHRPFPIQKEKEITIRSNITLSILKNLTASQIDSAHIFSFIFYTQTNYIRAIYPDFNMAVSATDALFKSMYAELSVQESKNLLTVIEKLYSENSKDLACILNNAWKTGKNQNLNELNDWKDVCDADSLQSFKENYHLLATFLYDHIKVFNINLIIISLALQNRAFKAISCCSS